MYKRELEKVLEHYKTFPVIAILGPWQSGKTTLVKNSFPNHKYITFEHEPTRQLAETDPEHFLKVYSNDHGLIIDEFQYAPKFLSYIQIEVDSKRRPGYFILTGSQNFLMNEAISQSLAGRIGILTLLPLSLKELEINNLLNVSLDEVIYKGSYPRLYYENLTVNAFYSSYIQTYVERDIRQLINVNNLNLFQRFVQLCAGRIGQLLSIESLANDCGVSLQTARSWLSILEASYIIFRLEPHYKNFNKRLTKSPKLYFYDVGLACSLLRITTPEILHIHPLRGHLFENLIIADFQKQYCNLGLRPSLYFWRDQNGRYEIDCIIDEGIALIPVEIKSALTIVQDFFKSLVFWYDLTKTQSEEGFVVYAGNEVQKGSFGTLIGWRHASELITRVHHRLVSFTAKNSE